MTTETQITTYKRDNLIGHTMSVIYIILTWFFAIEPFRSASCLAPSAASLAEDLRAVPLRQLHHGPHHRLRRQPLLHSVWLRPSSGIFCRQGRRRWKTCPQADLGADTGSIFFLDNNIDDFLKKVIIFSFLKITPTLKKVNIEFRRQSEQGVIGWLDQNFPPPPSSWVHSYQQEIWPAKKKLWSDVNMNLQC